MKCLAELQALAPCALFLWVTRHMGSVTWQETSVNLSSTDIETLTTMRQEMVLPDVILTIVMTLVITASSEVRVG